MSLTWLTQTLYDSYSCLERVGRESLANRALRESSHLLVHEIETHLDGWDTQEAEAVASGVERVIERGKGVRGSEGRGDDSIDHWVGSHGNYGVQSFDRSGVGGSRGHLGPG
jgi:hypothetical protein